MVNRPSVRWARGGLLLCLAGCKLQEESPLAMSGDATVVVHAVVNAAADSQFVIVEYADNGRPFPTGFAPTVFGQPAPSHPIHGAVVTLTVATPAAACTTAQVRLFEVSIDTLDGNPPMGSGVYLTRDLCPLRGGDVVTLHVTTRAGETVRGETTIPDASGLAISLVANGPTLDTLRLRRDRDSVWVRDAEGSAPALQIDVTPLDARFSPFQDVGYSLLIDSLGVVIPGDLVRPYQSDPNPPLFRAGSFYTFVVAATDRNLFDFARSGSDLFTGRGFINHLEGGIGVFGSVDPRRSIVRVAGPQRDPREGVYRLTGALGGERVDMTLDVFLLDFDYFGIGGPSFNALAEGEWAGDPLTSNARGQFDAQMVDGQFGLSVTFVGGAAPDTARYHVRGDPGPPGTPFSVEAVSEDGETAVELEAVQVTTGSNS